MRVRKPAPEGIIEAHRAPTNTATGSMVSIGRRVVESEGAELEDEEDDVGAADENVDYEADEDEQLVQPPPTEFATRATSGVVHGADEEANEEDNEGIGYEDRVDGEGPYEPQEDSSATPNGENE